LHAGSNDAGGKKNSQGKGRGFNYLKQTRFGGQAWRGGWPLGPLAIGEGIPATYEGAKGNFIREVKPGGGGERDGRERNAGKRSRRDLIRFLFLIKKVRNHQKPRRGANAEGQSMSLVARILGGKMVKK